MGLYCFWQSCANVSFISSFKDYFSSHKVVRGKAAQHTITIQRKCWDWKNNKLGCCRPQHVARGTCPGQHPSNWIILLTPARPHVYIYQLDKLRPRPGPGPSTPSRGVRNRQHQQGEVWLPDCWLYYVPWCPHLPRVPVVTGHYHWTRMSWAVAGWSCISGYPGSRTRLLLFMEAPGPAQPSPAQPCHPPRTFSVPAWQPPRSHHSH